MAKRVVNATLVAKNGNASNIELLKLLPGELAVTIDGGKMYFGNGTGEGNTEEGYVGKVLLNPDLSDSAAKLETARVIGIIGDGTGQTSFDGTQDVQITFVLKNSGVEAGTYTKVTVDSKGIVTSAEALSAEDIPDLTLNKITDAKSAAGYEAGNAAGKLPIVGADGKLDTSIMPSYSVTDTYPVESEEEMLALGNATPKAEKGDVAVRNDINKSFILAADDPSVLENWILLKTPTDMVYSVNNKTGNNITITAEDVGLGNVTNESKTTMFTDPTFTGNVVAPTPTSTDDSTKVATTAFVKAQGYLREDEALIIDGGRF